MNVRVFAIAVAAIVFATAPAAQLPAISWTCPMHPDVLEAKQGACSICGMDLVPVRLVLVYTCPVHAVIEQPKPGKCRICSRDLVQKTAALTFTCADNRDVSQIEPGKCADGSATVPRYTARAHGDHNPKHGGLFFMAPDNWHHLEGVYPAPGRFRVYVYDDFSKPISIAQARKVRGRVVTKEVFDPKTGTTRELASTPLMLARNGAFFEARIEPHALPAKMTAKISFTSEDKESRFDFAFPAYSRDSPTSAPPAQTAPVGKPNASTSAQAAPVDKPNASTSAQTAPVDKPNASTSAQTAPVGKPNASTAQTAPVDKPNASTSAQAATVDKPNASTSAQTATVGKPNASTSAPSSQIASAFARGASADKSVDKSESTPDSLLNDLKAQNAEVDSLLKSGALGGIYVPALRAKDLALEIQAKQPAGHQEAIEPSVKQIVLAAYQLDNYGDLGDAERAREALRSMSTAVAQLDSILSERRR